MATAYSYGRSGVGRCEAWRIAEDAGGFRDHRRCPLDVLERERDEEDDHQHQHPAHERQDSARLLHALVHLESPLHEGALERDATPCQCRGGTFRCALEPRVGYAGKEAALVGKHRGRHAEHKKQGGESEVYGDI